MKVVQNTEVQKFRIIFYKNTARTKLHQFSSCDRNSRIICSSTANFLAVSFFNEDFERIRANQTTFLESGFSVLLGMRKYLLKAKEQGSLPGTGLSRHRLQVGHTPAMLRVL